MELETRTELQKVAATIQTLDKQLSEYETGWDIGADQTDMITDAREGLQAAFLSLFKLDTNEVPESESTPEQLYQRTEPRIWQVGDLVSDIGGLKLCVQAERQYSTWICDTGNNWIADDIKQKCSLFVRNTGLQYTYRNIARLRLDYMNGLFTPYFEIL